jgi:hypothetical protein
MPVDAAAATYQQHPASAFLPSWLTARVPSGSTKHRTDQRSAATTSVADHGPRARSTSPGSSPTKRQSSAKNGTDSRAQVNYGVSQQDEDPVYFLQTSGFGNVGVILWKSLLIWILYNILELAKTRQFFSFALKTLLLNVSFETELDFALPRATC